MERNRYPYLIGNYRKQKGNKMFDAYIATRVPYAANPGYYALIGGRYVVTSQCSRLPTMMHFATASYYVIKR